jgi:hypothetical protein
MAEKARCRAAVLAGVEVAVEVFPHHRSKITVFVRTFVWERVFSDMAPI